jgi:NADPH:quinone reductase-like Zn-dependent oxidoreductase
MERAMSELAMRAARVHEAGGPEALRIDRLPIPVPGPDEAVVRVHAAALNRRDVFITQGLYPKIVFPATLGSDGAGSIHGLGSDVREHAVGDEVIIDPMLDWGDDEGVWNPRSSLLGMPSPGTFAQYVAVPARNLYPKPKALTMEQAAAIPLAGLTAYRALVVRGGLKPRETVLIPGVGGGVQTFALLFAKALGARAIVTSGSDEKLERAKALGADLALNYATTPDWQKALRDAGPIDLAVDSSGGDTIAKSLDALRPGGRLAIYGGTRGEATIRLFPIFWKHLTIVGTSMGSPADFAAMLALVERSGLQPAIDRVYPLDEIVEAAQRLARGDQFGKVVIKV